MLNNKNATINLENALLKVSGGDNAGKLTLGTGNTINMNLSSSIVAGSIVGDGKIVIDVTGFDGTKTQLIKADLSGFTGTIEIVGGLANCERIDNGLSLRMKL